MGVISHGEKKGDRKFIDVNVGDGKSVRFLRGWYGDGVGATVARGGEGGGLGSTCRVANSGLIMWVEGVMMKHFRRSVKWRWDRNVLERDFLGGRVNPSWRWSSSRSSSELYIVHDDNTTIPRRTKMCVTKRTTESKQ